MNHLPILPVVLPLALGALLLTLERLGLRVQRALGLTGALALVVVAAALAMQADGGAVQVYLAGNWPAHLGIALLADRTAALMVLLTAVLGLIALAHAASGWDRRAPHFHALFQFQLAGLCGAFLTADLFNLFVFFEVLLIASYGLLLSGGRGPRMRAGMHYLAFNITASLLFLVALGLIYGQLGTLNVGALAQRIALAEPAQAPLLRAAGGILLVVFCAKAALLPLYFWLPQAYSRAPGAVAALFAILTKVGIYSALRVYTAMFGGEAGELAGLAWPWLLPAGALTLALGTLGALAAPNLRLLSANLVVASAGTLFVAIGLATPETTAAGLYYLVHSTLATAALFLLADLIRGQRRPGGDSLRRIGRTGPRGLLGGLYLVAAVSLAGLPPLSGFVAKFSLLAAIPAAQAAWLWPLILICGLLTIVALARAGSRLFWHQAKVVAPAVTPPVALGATRLLPAMLLLALAVALSAFAAPALRYTAAAAGQLAAPRDYIDALRGATPRPSAHAAPEVSP
ncbi:MAG: monovalent cation/H+ antiporter subunit D [Rehaibacterium terrae]|uniref:monovalent cation/H+ antiporter subunit D n=1 Tax=Rehaibacterium terrae TaxID=1341696 RepID=UPI003918FF2D